MHDEGAVELWDLSSNFVFFESDVVGKSSAIVSVQKFQELNNTVIISTLTTKLTKKQLSDFQITVILINLSSLSSRLKFKVFLVLYFCDFGREFTGVDVDGEDPHIDINASISNDNPILVSCVDDERLEFQVKDLVVFSKVYGMT
ncbi:hypothetical protein V6N13_001165 [Hibiscus sabdariffa]|uniref:Uncharacterized protein n=1 Tax=Hibiscus sabdariffa TaxID=183260 RepID=A0ABR2G7J2_9ROSI